MEALTSSTRAQPSETAVNTRSGLTSDATSVATRRSARCSVASRPISASFSPGSAASASCTPRLGLSRSVRSIPVVTSAAGLPSGAGIGWLDQAISRSRPCLVRQWPTCGLGAPVRHTKVRNSPNASRSS